MEEKMRVVKTRCPGDEKFRSFTEMLRLLADKPKIVIVIRSLLPASSEQENSVLQMRQSGKVVCV